MMISSSAGSTSAVTCAATTSLPPEEPDVRASRSVAEHNPSVQLDHRHLDVFPGRLALDQLGHAPEPGVLLGQLRQVPVGRLVLGQGYEDHLAGAILGLADELE